MTAEAGRNDAVRVETVTHRYGRAVALDDVSLRIEGGSLVGLIGPDGVGKSTLLALLAGARRLQAGRVLTLGSDMGTSRGRRAVVERIAYMPQGLGRNLYGDLSVLENVEFFGRLFDLPGPLRRARIAEVLEATGLAPFADRPAAALSGGMKQKLGLCCALLHTPDLLILDEPTTGVDPLARAQFWHLIDRIRQRREGMTVIVATAYMEEAEGFERVIAMDRGRILAEGRPAEIMATTGAEHLEDAFIRLLPDHDGGGDRSVRPPPAHDGPPAIEAEDLTKRFGDFVAVDRVGFRIERGEIFGFLGSNGCGKTTTMKMLAGLLPKDGGTARILGEEVDATDVEAHARVGYMSQAFSLYVELTVRQNLVLHARLFGLDRRAGAARIDLLARRFGLADLLDQATEGLPLGVRQRLSLAVAILHEPDILILDEPTSGVDPIARDRFWELLYELSRDRGVTIFVSTHFMNEAERCDRISLMHAGRVLACGSPRELIEASGTPSLDEAFVELIRRAEGEDARQAVAAPEIAPSAARRNGNDGSPTGRFFSFRRLLAYAWREWLEIIRDPVRVAFTFLGSTILMLVLGYGLTLDVNRIRIAFFDQDQTSISRAYLEAFAGSPYFDRRSDVTSPEEVDLRLRSDDVTAVVEIEPNFGRLVAQGRRAEVAAWIDGAMPYQGETARSYIEGVHARAVAELKGIAPASVTPLVEPRFLFNQAFESIYAMAPNSIGLLLVFIPAILTALAVVREKETGSIVNFHVTPTTRAEFLVGKQAPYVAITVANCATLVVIAIVLFGVPMKGSAAGFALGALLYAASTTALGLFVSSFTRSQTAALFGTAIATVTPAIQFSGFITPTSSLEGAARIMGELFPTTHFLRLAVGTFTKGLDFADTIPFLVSLALFTPVLLAAAALLLRKQER